MYTPNDYIILETAGERPTVPLLPTLTPYDVDWRDSDIGIGQYAYNVADGVWIYRDSNGLHVYEDLRFKNLMASIEEINTNPGVVDFSEMFELKESGGVKYIQAKLDLFGAKGIAAYSTTEVDIPMIWSEMPYATTSTVGGIKVGQHLTINDGVLSVDGSQLGLNESAVITLVNTNTGISAYSAARLGGQLPAYYALTTHDHDTVYAALTHNHDLVYVALSLFNQMFSLESDGVTNYIQAKLDFFGAKGIQAYSTVDAVVPEFWSEMPYATASTVGGIKVGTSLKIVAGVLDIDGDTFNLANYYTKTDSDGRYGRLAFANTWAENQIISKNLTVTGNLYVNGTEFIANTQTVQIEDNLAIINYGEVGAGITAGFAGWEIDRGTADNFRFGFAESPGFFQVGKVGAMQTVATREDVPTNNYYAKWNSTLKRFDTAIPAFSEIGSKPTTLSGYGITDAYTKTDSDTRYGRLAEANTWAGANIFSSELSLGSNLHKKVAFAQNAAMSSGAEYVVAKIAIGANVSNALFQVLAYVQLGGDAGRSEANVSVRAGTSVIDAVKFHQEKVNQGMVPTIKVYKIGAERSIIITVTPNAATQNWGYTIEGLSRHTATITRQTSVLLFSAHADYANRSEVGITEYVPITKNTTGVVVNGNIEATGEVTAYAT